MAKEFTIKMETKRFNSHIQRMVNKYPNRVNIILKKFAFDLLRLMISNTTGYRHPVDTGRARAGWYASARNLGMSWSEVGNDSSAILEGKSLGSYKEKLTGSKRYIDLINAVKYILFLEYGHSQQAPWGMVRLNMRKLSGDKLPHQLGIGMQIEWKKVRR